MIHLTRISKNNKKANFTFKFKGDFVELEVRSNVCGNIKKELWKVEFFLKNFQIAPSIDEFFDLIKLRRDYSKFNQIGDNIKGDILSFSFDIETGVTTLKVLPHGSEYARELRIDGNWDAYWYVRGDKEIFRITNEDIDIINSWIRSMIDCI